MKLPATKHSTVPLNALVGVVVAAAILMILGVVDEVGGGFLLARLEDERAVDRLLALLEDGNVHVRTWAVLALGQLGAERAVGELLALLKDDDMLVRMSAWGMAERILVRHAREPVLEVLSTAKEPAATGPWSSE